MHYWKFFDVISRRWFQSDSYMRALIPILFLAGTMLTGCRQPTKPSDTDQQQGNPRAQPEKGATASSNQPEADKAGKDAHTLSRPDSRKQ
jgi:hypothetical protein